MKLGYFLAFYLLFLLFWSCTPTEKINVVRDRVDFGKDWLFQKGDTIKPADWIPVSLPHTANIEPLVVNYQWQGISWYKKEFTVEKGKENKNHFIYFEGVMQEADVWLNGKKVTNHKGGYLPFTVDISNEIKTTGNNEILVRVDNQDNETIPPGKELKVLDFNLYGGIYRNTYLITTGDVYITDAVHANEPNSGGILVHFKDVSESFAKGIVKSHVKNASELEKHVHAVMTFSDNEGLEKVFKSKEIVIKPNASETIEQLVTIN
ncbi:MAG: sugar-binding domain-containing protein, partial [Pricia sp.]